DTGSDYYALEYTYGYTLGFFKVNEQDEPMAEVSFTLKTCDSTEDTATCTGDPQDADSNSDGLVEFAGLAPGRYLLTETKTHPGYQLPQGQWFVDFDPTSDTPVVIMARGDSSMTLPPAFKQGSGDYVGEMVLPNYRATVLPNLGGHGLMIWMIAGVALIGCAVIYLVPTRPGNRRRHSIPSGRRFERA
ncbi:MAG: prealbumin-like fold domain-containing protein, partial [Propionibacteriaceae bacterium]|nr:prealbumin-like fold domain-containing protein [Propionibacteriaceae bacterium]